MQPINILIFWLPVGIAAYRYGWSELWVFWMIFLAIIPLAKVAIQTIDAVLAIPTLEALDFTRRCCPVPLRTAAAKAKDARLKTPPLSRHKNVTTLRQLKKASTL